jgi:sugar O-acyltransferase (sialic acid O-acetyltransferase NeuD family)
MNLIIVASSGGQHAAVIYEAAVLAGMKVAGFVTVTRGSPIRVLDCPHLGDLEDFEWSAAPDELAFVVASGSNQLRREITEALIRKGRKPHTVVHPSAIVSPSATIDAGSMILAGAIIGPSTRIGCSSIVNHGASVDHDCVVGDYVNICPGARIGGGAYIGRDVFIGLNGSVLQGVRIGDAAVVAAGAVVIAEVCANSTVAGVPAKLLKRLG